MVCSRSPADRAEQQLENGALSRARPADERYLLALFHGHGEVRQNALFPVTERHMREHDVAPHGALPLFGDGALRLGEKGVDTLYARHGGLNGLDLHAETFDRRENAGDIMDNGDGRADRHAEQRQDLRFAGGGEQHDDADPRRRSKGARPGE